MPWASRIVLTIEETDAGSHAAAALVLASLVALPDDLLVLFGDRGFRGFDGETERFSGLFQGDGDEFAVRGVVDRVVEEIPENLTHALGGSAVMNTRLRI